MELLPCPFCGAEPHGVFGPSEHLGSCWVECWGGPPDSCCGSWHFEGSREETAEAWNRRADQHRVTVEMFDQLREHYEQALSSGRTISAVRASLQESRDD